MTKSHLTAEPNNVQQTQNQIKQTVDKRKTITDTLSIAESNLTALENTYFKKQSGFFNKLFTKKETVENIGLEIEETRKQVNSLKDELATLTVDINNLNKDITEEQYSELLNLFNQVCRSNKIWNIISTIRNTETKSSAANHIDRKEVNFSTTELDFINSKFKALFFKNLNGPDLFIYPSFLLNFTPTGEIRIADIKELNFSFRAQRFIEPKVTIPPDSKIIDHVWEKVNKDGSPDLRFKGNFQTPVVRYGVFEFSDSTGIDTSFYISNYEIAESFANSFQKIIKPATSSNTYSYNSPFVPKTEEYEFTEHYYELLTDFSRELKSITKKLSKDKILADKLENSLGDTPVSEFIPYCVIYDLCQVAKALNDGDYDKDDLETTGLVLTTNQILSNSTVNFLNEQYETVALSHSKGLYKGVAEVIINIGNNDNPLKIDITHLKDNEITSSTKLQSSFAFPQALKIIDHPFFDEYVSMLYKFANIIAKADNHISKEEERRLKEIYQITHHPIPEQVNKSLIVTNTNETIEEISEELESLIGLEGVKQEIKTLINFIKVQKAREASGLKASNISYHIVFTGNPGTGKTTVARIVAKIYKALGILSQGQLVETDRSGLIAEYVGQTAVKVNKTVDSAMNGVLFIDEAYSIAGETQNDFGKEAIATLIKRMEDDRDKLIVVVAGYTNEMKTFIETNPGFKSRFNRYVEFTDYSPNELLAIYQSQCSKLEYKLTDDAKAKLATVFEQAYSSRDKSFGNGRFVRNVFEKSLERQANRIAGIGTLDKETLTTIIADDIP